MQIDRATFRVVLIGLFLSGTSLGAIVVPIGLPAGSTYRIAFVTADTFTAYDSNIADYNADVTAEASTLSSLLPAGITWTVIASTPNVNAEVNSPPRGVPVYNTIGEEVVAGTTGLYNGTLLNPIDYDQFGNVSHSEVWTGTYANGTSDPTFCLGGAKTESVFGYSYLTDSGWLNLDPGTRDSDGAAHTLYGLSSPITVTPEPTSGIFLFGMTFALRRFRKAPKSDLVCVL